MSVPLRTALYDSHRRRGASLVSFGGWEMPLFYSGIVPEHLAVRSSAGLFDVSHMGNLLLEGRGARTMVQRLNTNTIPTKPGRGRYSHLTNEEGKIIDDVIVFCVAPEGFLLICNAGPRPKVLSWLGQHRSEVGIHDLTLHLTYLAFQGKSAEEALQKVCTPRLSSLKLFEGAWVDLDIPFPPTPPETKGWGGVESELSQELADLGFPLGRTAFVSRTGYTGEPGFEILCPNPVGVALWEQILQTGEPKGILPIGLGARDTLRLEKGYLLSGQDFDGRQTPLEAGCEWLVKWDHDFIGKEALLRQKESLYPRLRGFLCGERGIPRHGGLIHVGGRKVGDVTSGTFSPTLKRGIGLGYLIPESQAAGTSLEIEVRGKRFESTVVETPFL